MVIIVDNLLLYDASYLLFMYFWFRVVLNGFDGVFAGQRAKKIPKDDFEGEEDNLIAMPLAPAPASEKGKIKSYETFLAVHRPGLVSILGVDCVGGQKVVTQQGRSTEYWCPHPLSVSPPVNVCLY